MWFRSSFSTAKSRWPMKVWVMKVLLSIKGYCFSFINGYLTVTIQLQLAVYRNWFYWYYIWLERCSLPGHHSNAAGEPQCVISSVICNASSYIAATSYHLLIDLVGELPSCWTMCDGETVLTNFQQKIFISLIVSPAVWYGLELRCFDLRPCVRYHFSPGLAKRILFLTRMKNFRNFLLKILNIFFPSWCLTAWCFNLICNFFWISTLLRFMINHFLNFSFQYFLS